ncbi:MAG: hypothetical protein ACXADH_15775 [Candidatus Kariarchaeaceae archaeon]|jgi:hypothetical protein
MKDLAKRKFDRKLEPIGGEEDRPGHVKTPSPGTGIQPSIQKKKGPSNKPLRGRGGRFEEIDVGKLINFIMENHDKPDKLKGHPQNGEILDILNHLLAVSMGGWREEDGVYVNESGRCASMENWELYEGQLAHKERNVILDDKEWIHNARKAIIGSGG